VHIWDPVTGKTTLVIDMPKGITGNKFDMALYVQWTPDGKRLLSLTGDRYSLGSQDYDLLVWDAASGELISSIEIANQAEPVSGELSATAVNYPTGAAAEIAPHSGRLATLGGDNSALIWDSAWQKPALVLNGHTKGVSSVDWSPDESRLVTASLDGTAMIWDAQTGQTLHTLAGHEGRVNLALWSPDGNQIATVGADGVVRLWNATDGKLKSSIATNYGEIFSLAWVPNGVRIFTGHGDGSLRIWEAASGKPLETLRGHQGIASDLKWSPVDDRLASGDGSGYARIWNAAPSTAWRLYPPQARRGGDWSVNGASWSSDGRYLAMAGGDVVGSTEPPSFSIWDVQANQQIIENLGDALNFMGLEAHFSPDDQAILYLGYPVFPDFSGLASAYVFDARSGEIIRTFTPGGETLIRTAAWSPDGSKIATGLFENQIIIWNYQTGKQIARLVHGKDQNKQVCSVKWAPDGSKIASSGDESYASVWDALNWELLYTPQHQPPAGVISIDWSPDGTRLLSTAGNDEQGAKDTTARIWDGATGKELLVFRGHTKSVWPGDWAPDGRRIATFSNDGTVRVWDTSTGDELLTITVPVLYGGSTWWSPGGQHLAIVGLETLVSVWRVWQTTQELIDYAKECCVIRSLTDAERQQFGLE
jgi:WD40 repeat protein